MLICPECIKPNDLIYISINIVIILFTFFFDNLPVYQTNFVTIKLSNQYNAKCNFEFSQAIC